MDIAEVIASLLLNIISSDMHQNKENILQKHILYKLQKNMLNDLRSYINAHDGSVLTTDAFEKYLLNYNIVEKILAHVCGNGESISKIDYLKNLVVLFENSGHKKTCWSDMERKEVANFLCFLYDTVDVFCRKRLSNNERYSLQAVLSAKAEIKEFIASCSNNAMTLLYSIENNIKDIQSQGSFKKLLESVDTDISENRNAFHYLNTQMVNIYGRDAQLNLLNDFLDFQSNYSFCVITGPGGVGKSKLAFSFMKQQNEHRKDWTMYFANDDLLSKMANCNCWNHDSHILLIVDYAGTSLDSLHKSFVRIAKCESDFKNKLRIVLLDRIGMTKKYDPGANDIIVEYPYWYKFLVKPQKRDLYADAEYISKYLFTEFIELEGLSEEDYKNLIDDYISTIAKNNANKQKHMHYTISNEQIWEVINFARRTSNSLQQSRPLFIMLATDAIINGRDISCWDTTKMVEYIYERDRRQWKDNIQDNSILRSLEYALIYATIFGEWCIEHSFQIGNRNIGEDIEICLQTPDMQGPIKDWLTQMCEVQDCSVSLLKMKAYEPDIVGEFYVLKQLESCTSSKNDWYNLIFNNLARGRGFLERACQDYANTNLVKVLVEILNKLTDRITQDYVKEAEMIVRIWRIFLSEVTDKTYKGIAISGIKKICKDMFCQSKYIDEINIILFYKDLSDQSNTLREYRLPDYKLFYKKWPDSVEIANAYINVLGKMASWYYRNGNLPKGNAYSKTLNSVISECNIHEGDILVNYIDALGNIISGHYYMNDEHDVQAEIDDHFKLESLVAELKTESHAVAYVDAIKKALTQQSKYTADYKIVKSIEQFCMHINEWMENEDWYIFRWNIGSVIPFVIDLLFTYGKTISGEKLFNFYFALIRKYIDVQYTAPDLIISHFGTGLDKLAKSQMIPKEILERICDFSYI